MNDCGTRRDRNPSIYTPSTLLAVYQKCPPVWLGILISTERSLEVLCLLNQEVVAAWTETEHPASYFDFSITMRPFPSIKYLLS